MGPKKYYAVVSVDTYYKVTAAIDRMIIAYLLHGELILAFSHYIHHLLQIFIIT